MKKQTAVEWLIDELNGYEEDCEIFRIAKAMEKEQLKDAWHDGFRFDSKYNNCKEYYNETYGDNK